MACVVVALAVASTAANAATAVDRVRSALDKMHGWVDEGPHGQAWREYLQSQRLESELAKGAQADAAAVRQILDAYSSGAQGLELPEFVDVRETLGQWLAELSPPSLAELPAEVEAAKSRFVPVTKAELQTIRSRLRAAVDRLDARLAEVGPDGNGWRSYLHWSELEAELARGDRADLDKLDEVFARFDSGREGLDLVCFFDVRRALYEYLAAARAMSVPDLKVYYGQLLDNLAKQLRAMPKVPTARQVAEVVAAIGWLRDTRQGDRLIQRMRGCFHRPNLVVEVSSDLVRAGIDRPIDDTAPVADVILGTDVRGTGRTTGRLAAELVPNADRAEIALVFHGKAETDTVGYHGPAQIYSDGLTQLRARKSLRLGALGVEAPAATAEAETSTRVAGIGLTRGGKLAHRIACNRVQRQKGEADREAERHAERKVGQRLNDEVTQMLRKSEDKPVSKLATYLSQRAWLPGELHLATSREAAHLVVTEADAGHLSAPGAPPPLAGKLDLAVRLHESMVNNWSARALPGFVLTEDRLQTVSRQILGREIEEFKSREDQEPWSISFDYVQPIFVSFGDGEFTVALHGRSYTTGERVLPALDVTAHYRITKTGQGLKAIRQGDLRVYPPDFVPDVGKHLSLSVKGQCDLLGRRFENILPKEIVPEPLKLPKPWDAAGELVLSQWETRQGWMVLGWKRTPPSTPAPPSGPTR